MDKILDNLFLGNVMDAQAVLTDGSAAVLSVGAEFLENEYDVYIALDNSANTKRKIINIWDGSIGVIESQLLTAFNFINNNKPVLVHCMAGRSRSPAIVWAYLLYLKYDPIDAYNLIKQSRPIIDPYFGFLKEIMTSFGFSEQKTDCVLQEITKINKGV